MSNRTKRTSEFPKPPANRPLVFERGAMPKEERTMLRPSPRDAAPDREERTVLRPGLLEELRASQPPPVSSPNPANPIPLAGPSRPPMNVTGSATGVPTLIPTPGASGPIPAVTRTNPPIDRPMPMAPRGAAPSSPTTLTRLIEKRPPWLIASLVAAGLLVGVSVVAITGGFGGAMAAFVDPAGNGPHGAGAELAGVAAVQLAPIQNRFAKPASTLAAAASATPPAPAPADTTPSLTVTIAAPQKPPPAIVGGIAPKPFIAAAPKPPVAPAPPAPAKPVPAPKKPSGTKDANGIADDQLQYVLQ